MLAIRSYTPDGSWQSADIISVLGQPLCLAREIIKYNGERL
jgi:hypothetical protein